MTIDIHNPTLATDEELAAQMLAFERTAPPDPDSVTNQEEAEEQQLIYEAWMAEEIYRNEPNDENLAYRGMTLDAIEQMPDEVQEDPEPE